jgi:hypothetical protein
MAKKSEHQAKPPYIPYRTLISSIERMKEIGVPPRIDTSVFRGQANSTIAALVASFRFLGLSDADNKTTPLLRKLVDAEGEARSAVLKEMLLSSYTFLALPEVDLANATNQQVESAFRAQGIEGSTIYRAMSFFIAAAADAKLTHSKYIKPPSPKPTNGIKKTKQKEASTPPPPPPHAPTHKAHASPAEQLLAKFPDFDPNWDAETQKKWFDSFGALRTAMLKE